MSLVLYDYVLSGSCYKVRLLLSLLGQDYRAEPVDFYPGRAHKAPEFLALNPLGQIPVLVDGDLVLRDAQAILVYLASRYDPDAAWYPDEPAARGRVAMWLAFAGGELMAIAAARLHDLLGAEVRIEEARAAGHRALRVLDDHLTETEIAGGRWIAAARPTIADIACFPYVALSHDGGIPLDRYLAVQRWTGRVMALPGFIDMPGVPRRG